MKILHVAVFTPNSTNVWQADAFEQLGHEVIRFDYRQIANEIGLDDRDIKLVGICKDQKPDITLFSKCNIMHYRVVECCRAMSKTIMWLMDGMENYDSELADKIGHCDFTFCSVQACVNESKKYCKKVYRLQGGYNAKVHYPMDIPKIRDVSFIGVVHGYVLPYRAQLLNEVNFDVINGVYNQDHSKVVSETKINLSLTNNVGVSNRIYKLMAAKGFVLTMPWEGIDIDFKVGTHLDIFHNVQELKYKIKYYLENSDIREKIAVQGYKKVKDYDNINYAKTIIKMVTQ